MPILVDSSGHSRFRALGPSVAAVPPAEALRAGIGAVLGLAVATGLAVLASPDLWLGIYLIAPFGASSVLIFAAPNSPLAQPWPAIVGNTLSALVALLVCRVVANPMIAVPASVGAAIIVMALCRATHPPGGAVAMTVAIGADRIAPLGLGFALMPVAGGTALLVAVGALYALGTGRRYPFRQFGEVNASGTTDPSPPERLGLTEDELAGILVRYNQSLNLGVEDLARLIAAAEMQAASHRTRAQVAGDIMSRDLVTVAPDTPLLEIAALFSRHGFTSLPVVGANGRYLGVIFQLHLIARVHARFRPDGRLSRLDHDLRAVDVMDGRLPTARPGTPIAALLPSLASNSTDAVPVLESERIVGIVTRTDLVAALARESLRRDD
ncbi:HPP family protein [Paracoccus sp. AK26]|uniref:HPP family protein n=1 Tax=Paracoccus sp. AK26 TaxID=2589076 RepID=UPI001428303F|nr:HPP family protein [Paracoccus sp. AK26]QIR85698.1 CBS domain-containing protein [Paracoccus sp. AK26]